MISKILPYVWVFLGSLGLTLLLTPLTDNEREILLRGCLMNYYAAHQKD